MPRERRQELVRALRELNVIGIEDHVYAFLIDDPSPLASLAPDHVVMIDSLSKRVAPGLTLGWVLAPTHLVPALAEAIRASALVPSGLALELCVRWMADGTVARLVRDKRRDAAARQRLLRKACPDLTIQADPRAYHAWVELPGRVAGRVVHGRGRRARHRRGAGDGVRGGSRPRAERGAAGPGEPDAQSAGREPPDAQRTGPVEARDVESRVARISSSFGNAGRARLPPCLLPIDSRGSGWQAVG